MDGGTLFLLLIIVTIALAVNGQWVAMGWMWAWVLAFFVVMGVLFYFLMGAWMLILKLLPQSWREKLERMGEPSETPLPDDADSGDYNDDAPSWYDP